MKFNADYHIHHHLDICASEEMILPNIDAATHEIGLQEIAVLAHCSAPLPNGGSEWGWWHSLNESNFEIYLSEVKGYTSKFGTKIYTGVETELMDSDGNVAVTPHVEESVDMFALSLHYMPNLSVFPWKLSVYPPTIHTDSEREEYSNWLSEISSVKPEDIISCCADSIVKAIGKYPKIRTLAHLDTMTYILELYGIDFSSMTESANTEALEPLMKAAAENGVLWEVTNGCPIHPLFQRAKELGVKFTPTSDAHMLYEGWGALTRRVGAVRNLEKMGLEGSQIIIR